MSDVTDEAAADFTDFVECALDPQGAAAEVARLRAAVDAVRKVCAEATEANQRSLGRMFGGGLFPTNVGVVDVLAALDGAGEGQQ